MRTVQLVLTQTVALTAPLSEAAAAVHTLLCHDKNMLLTQQLGMLIVLHNTFERTRCSLGHSMKNCTRVVPADRYAKIVEHTRSMPRFFRESARVLKDIADRIGNQDFVLITEHCVKLLNALCIQQRMAQKALEKVQGHLHASSRPQSNDGHIDDILDFALSQNNNLSIGDIVIANGPRWRPRPKAKPYSVFVSHAGEDKRTIAEPLWRQLEAKSIRTFLDVAELRVGDHAPRCMENAMETANICVVILSPEYAAKKWPMKELQCFLRRRKQADATGDIYPIVIPVFYRLAVSECGNDNIFHARDEDGRRVFFRHGFFEREAREETSVEQVLASLRVVKSRTGIENDWRASNEPTPEAQQKRGQLVCAIAKAVQEALENSKERTFLEYVSALM